MDYRPQEASRGLGHVSPERDPIAEARQQWLAHGWVAAADGMEMITSLVRVNQLVNERIDAVLRPINLTFARYEILRLLAFTRRGSMPMTRLGSLLQVHPASVTSAVDRLERQGFVLRERGEQDGRVVLAGITAEGRDIVEKATERLNGEVFAETGLTDEQVRAMTTLLSAYRREAGDLRS
ncbi:MAG: MarR family winged helix-turn-helix transcriptional regulator [Marmoricola sp.]